MAVWKSVFAHIFVYLCVFRELDCGTVFAKVLDNFLKTSYFVLEC